MKQVFECAYSIVKKLQDAGYTTYFAGGWVRDYLMGHPSEDIDIATSAPLEFILELFPKTYQVGIAFGVVIVAVEGHHFEVATFRRDIDYSSGRRPAKIELADPEEDALRRDFTINGMFYDPVKEVIIDYVRGQHDIKQQLIRAIGDPYERFEEDRLRMIRAVRFSARFCFTIDLGTEEAIRLNSHQLYPAVAVERVWQELVKMARYPTLDTALIALHRLDLLTAIFPSLEGIHLNDVKKRVVFLSHIDVGQYSPLLCLLPLFGDESEERLVDWSKEFKLSKKERKLVEIYVKARMLAPSLLEEKYDRWQLCHLLAAEGGLEALQICGQVMSTDRAALYLSTLSQLNRSLLSHIQRLKENKPLVNSNHLRQLGVPAGPLMGHLLRLAEKMAIEKDLHTHTEITELLQTSMVWPRIAEE